MTVYVDDFRVPKRIGRINARWSHLTADTPDELHGIAEQLGLKRTWYQDKGDGRWHYDVTDTKRSEAIALGATPIGLRDMGQFLVARRNGLPWSPPEQPAPVLPALTLWRPWTTCIVDLPAPLAKPVENRGWATKYRGDFYLHGGKAFAAEAIEVAEQAARQLGCCLTVGKATVCYDAGALLSPDPADHPTGLVGVATLTGVCSASVHTTRLACECGPWAFPGNYHWQLANVRRLLRPVPCNGGQQFWRPPADVVAAAAVQLAAVVA